MYNIRLAKPTDIEQLADLEYRLFPQNNLGEVTLQEELVRSNCFIAESDGVAVGYSIGRRERRVTDVLRIGVLSEHRGRKVGVGLLRKQYLEVPTILSVNKDNEQARRMYKSEGFRIAGALYLDGAPSVCLVMLRPCRSADAEDTLLYGGLL